MIIYKEIIQGSAEWFKIRSKKVSASHAQSIAAMGSGLDTYVSKLVAEHFSSQDKEHFSNEDTDRGNELEPLARDMYELEKEVKVDQVGFIKYNEYVGCSPDGLIGEEGGLEIKSPKDEVYFNILMEKEKAIESKYIWQCQMNLLISERKWWDLMYYNPNYDKPSIVFRIYPDEVKQNKLRQGFIMAEEKIKQLEAKYQNL